MSLRKRGGCQGEFQLTSDLGTLINIFVARGNLQTGYCVVGDFSQVDKVEYDR